MQIKNRMVTIGTTLFLAAATGHIMQNEDAIVTKLHQLGLHYTELASADRMDPTRARVSVVGVKRIAEGVLIAASVSPDSETLLREARRDQDVSTAGFDLGKGDTGDVAALKPVTVAQ